MSESHSVIMEINAALMPIMTPEGRGYEKPASDVSNTWNAPARLTTNQL
jgi:hypothetical protein